MSYWYPQAAVQLRILPEDYKLISDATLQKVYVVNVLARDVTISRNDYKTSDTFSLEIDYKSFPFDPRTIRSCGVIIYMQDMGTLGNKIVPGGKNPRMAGFQNQSFNNAIFAGFVDTDEISLDDGHQTVKLEGRDYTALLIDQKYQTNSPIALNEPIDKILTRLLATFKATKEIQVINRTGGELPTLAQYYPDFGGSALAGHKNVSRHESYWEIIQDLVGRAGLICFINIDKLILTTPKNQHITTADDIKFIYGKNIKNLMFKRKLGRFKGFGIEVRSRVGKKVIMCKIPEEATPEWAKAFGIERKQVFIPVLKPDGSLDANNQHPAPYIVFPVPNIANKDQLIRIGQTTYEQYSLQQFEGSLETVEMMGRGQSYDSRGQPKSTSSQYDLTQIQKGQSIVIELETDDLAAISRMSSSQARAQYLIKNNYNPEVASIFAKTMGKFSPRFFIKSYHMGMNQDNGFNLKIEFINVLDLTQRGLS